MNRQIKFRIWDKSRKAFLENGASLHCYSHWMMDVFTGTLYDAIGTIDGDRVDPNHRYLHEDDGYYLEKGQIVKESPYVIQQFTGLQDKNGKDIYEGDILTINPGEDKVRKEFGNFFFENVLLAEVQAGARNPEGRVIRGVYNQSTGEYIAPVYGDFSEGVLSQFTYFLGVIPFPKFKVINHSMVVVGNVFENPELLK